MRARFERWSLSTTIRTPIVGHRSPARAMGDPPVDRFSVDTFASYRAERVKAGIAPDSVNREHAYLRSMFNELRGLGQWKGDNLLSEGQKSSRAPGGKGVPCDRVTLERSREP